MKKVLLYIILCTASTNIFAETLYNQLCAFNFNWRKYENRVPVRPAVHFDSDREYIQTHLSCVLDNLRTNDLRSFDNEQLQNRSHLIQLLSDYRERGIFPMNYYCEERIPVFIDEHDTFCAVGYLMQQSGFEDLARNISAYDNYVWVQDINNPAAVAWQQWSGFTMEELKIIQGAYDYYLDDARFLPNKYEVPQKPECIVDYFENDRGHRGKETEDNLWCRGEGSHGVLNGKWTQNFSPGMPWIVGYYEDGKRSGQWEEYYQGTKKLCRTENWRNDKLNGIRRRFDLEGRLIEEILFRDGKAIVKTNYDLSTSMVFVRKQIDSVMVFTEIYDCGGALLAAGNEKIYNPGNLLWFQNIELTALNSAAISAKSNIQTSQFQLPLYSNPFGKSILYNTPALVQYKKEGTWKYYPEYYSHSSNKKISHFDEVLKHQFKQFEKEIGQSLSSFDSIQFENDCDSLLIFYNNNLIKDLYAYGASDFAHLCIRYHTQNFIELVDNRSFQFSFPQEYEIPPTISEVGTFTPDGLQSGIWKHFDEFGQLYKIENFIVPRRDSLVEQQERL